MGERKVLNKYYPPDFDPAKIPRRRQPKNKQMKVRMMLPMSIRCNTCGNYIYKGTKFNSRKEDVEGENYLGIQIFRFYFKCTRCSAELTFKTDPQNSDYVMESGASRNFEPWRAADEAMDEEKRKRDAEELGDAMKALENRTIDSKQEMDIIAALDEMKSMRARQRMVNTDAMLAVLREEAEEKEREIAKEDDELVRKAFSKKPVDLALRIILDEDEDEDATNGELQKRVRPYDSSASNSKRTKALTGSDASSGPFLRPTDMLLSGTMASTEGSLQGAPLWMGTIVGAKPSQVRLLVKPKQPGKTAAALDAAAREGEANGTAVAAGKSEAKGRGDAVAAGKSEGKGGGDAYREATKSATQEETPAGSSPASGKNGGASTVMAGAGAHVLEGKGNENGGAGLASLMASYQGASDSEDELE